MNTSVAMVSLSEIDLPKTQVREKYSPAGYARLKDSIAQHGILVPVVLRRMSGGRLQVVDGWTRLAIAGELGWPGSTKVPAMVAEIDDKDALTWSVVINQMRERLAKIYEWRALKALIKRGVTQENAAKSLGKTQGWASQMVSLDRLPAAVRNDIESGAIPISHGVVMVPYSDSPAILDMMVSNSKSGNATTSNLRNIGVTSEKEGVRAGGLRAPSTHKVGKHSWVRIEPLAGGVRAELHVHDDEDADKVTAKANELIRKMRGE